MFWLAKMNVQLRADAIQSQRKNSGTFCDFKCDANLDQTKILDWVWNEKSLSKFPNPEGWFDTVTDV